MAEGLLEAGCGDLADICLANSGLVNLVSSVIKGQKQILRIGSTEAKLTLIKNKELLQSR